MHNTRLYFDEKVNPKPVVCDEDPQTHGDEVGKEQVEVGVGLLLPAEGEVTLQNLAANVHQYGVHSCRGGKGLNGLVTGLNLCNSTQTLPKVKQKTILSQQHLQPMQILVVSWGRYYSSNSSIYVQTNRDT